ncbi:MAG: ribosome maturation factor RimP [Nitrosomonas sp.]|nr:ribosome maturation factor RimP [Nitrosomonas sp.]
MLLFELLEPTLAGMGYELVEVEQLSSGKLLRVFVDKPDSGITLDDCVAVSNHLAQLLAVENIAYSRLEVSSPGLDRPLKKKADFFRYQGETVRIRLRIPWQGQKNFVGKLHAMQDDIVILETDGGLLRIQLNNVDKARLVPKFDG